MSFFLDLFADSQEPNLFFEKNKNFPLTKIIGLDEVGRGCIAGPVVACAVILPTENLNKINLDTHNHLLSIRDSKKLTEKKRELLFEPIKSFLSEYSFGVASSEEIDKINIFQATFLAMKRALLGLKTPVSQVLIDGKFAPKDLPQFQFTPIIQGDGKSLSIACASILAKVYRDRLMCEYDQKYPEYFFSKHKGYGTKAHLLALKKHGVLSFHRRSFEPVKNSL